MASRPSPTSGPTPDTAPKGVGVPALRRSSSNKYLAGVAGGIGEFLGLAPNFIRVAWVLIGFVGPGLPLYLIAAALMPDEATGTSALDRLFGPDRKAPAPVLVGIAVATALFFGSVSLDGGLGVVVPFLLIVGGAVLVVRGTPEDPSQMHMPPPPTGEPLPPPRPRPPVYTIPSRDMPPPPDPTAPVGPHPRWVGQLHDAPVETLPASGRWAPPTTVEVPVYRSGRKVRQRRQRSHVSRLTLLTVVTLLGFLGVADQNGLVELTLLSALAIILTTIGLGLTVAAWFGRARGLIVLGSILTIVLTAGVFVRDLVLSAEDRIIAPTAIDQLPLQPSLETGQLRIDLTSLDRAELAELTEPLVLRPSVELGGLVLVIPSDVPIKFTGTTHLGVISSEPTGIPPIEIERSREGHGNGAFTGEDPDMQLLAGVDQTMSVAEDDPQIIINATVETGLLSLERTQ